MRFSYNELTAILNIGNAMIMADGRVDKSETELLSNELLSFGVSLNDAKKLMEASVSMRPAEAMAIISSFNYEQKKYVSSFLGTIMASDGDIDERELALWKLVSAICGLPAMTISEAIDNMCSNG